MDLDTLNKLLCSNCGYVISYGPVHITTTGRQFCGRCSIPRQETEEKFVRNNTFETLAKNLNFPCRNKERGCTVELNPEVLQNHEGMCPYSLHGCPKNTLDNQCDWVGRLEEIEEHYKEKHKELIVSHPYTEKPTIKKNYIKYMIFTYLNFVFLLQQKCSIRENVLWYNVLFLGPPHLAKLFSFTVKMSRGRDFIVKNNPVQPFGRFYMAETDCVKQRINNIFQELGDYGDIEFSLSVSMEHKLTCAPCGRVLDSGPICYTDKGENWCSRCFNTSEETHVSNENSSQNESATTSSASQQTNTSTADKNQIIKETDNELPEIKTLSLAEYMQIKTEENKARDVKQKSTKKYPIKCIVCNKINSNSNDRCSWCNIINHLKDNTKNTGSIRCNNKIKGCPYRHNNNNIVAKHENYLCKYEKSFCLICQRYWHNTTFIEHMLQNHCTIIRADVKEKVATANFYHKLQPTGHSYYAIHIRGLVLYLTFRHTPFELFPTVVANTELGVSDIIDITFMIDGSKTITLKEPYSDCSSTLYDPIDMGDFKKHIGFDIRIQLMITIKE